MPRTNARRWMACLAGLWAGVIFGIGAIATPAAFASMPSTAAGALAGRMFMHEAGLSLALCVVLMLLAHRVAAREAEAGAAGSVFSGELTLALGALFCTMFGYYALQPMMVEARAGKGLLTFAALHGIAAVFFVAKGLLVLTLAWRATRTPIARANASPLPSA